jgi:hypothetical protein
MFTTNPTKFKGEIENYLRNGQNKFDSTIDRAFSCLKFKTWLSRTDIRKKDGYPTSHLLFVLFLLPVLKLKTVNSFCNKHWYQWSVCRKDAFYRFKQGAYRWRSFMYKVIKELFRQIDFNKQSRFFVIDDSVLPKRGKHIENVSFVYDHCLGRSTLGYGLVKLGLLTENGYYPLDFSYWFSARRHAKSPAEVIGDPRSISGQRSHEAKTYSKLDLALQMIKRAVGHGIRADYVLFDSWYAWPSLIKDILKIKGAPHVICRLKNSKTKFEYGAKKYRLSELYQRVRKHLKKSKRTGLLLKRIRVKMPGSNKTVTIVFAKGYCEPQAESTKSKKKPEQPRWVAFLCTDGRLQAATIIKHYTKRWAAEVCFKECKQLLDLGKDQSNSFQAQVFATTVSFLRYAVLNYLNETEHRGSAGSLFEHLVDESAQITYAQKLWEFFRGLFKISFSKIFELFKIEEEFQSYFSILDQLISESAPFRRCET